MSGYVGHAEFILQALAAHQGRAKVEAQGRHEAVAAVEGHRGPYGRSAINPGSLKNAIEAGLLRREGDEVTLNEDHLQTVELALLVSEACGIDRSHASHLLYQRRVLMGGKLPPHMVYNNGWLDCSATSISFARAHPDIELIDFGPELHQLQKRINQERRALSEEQMNARRREPWDTEGLQTTYVRAGTLQRLTLRAQAIMREQTPNLKARHDEALAADCNAERVAAVKAEYAERSKRY